MTTRKPIVSGQFYAADEERLDRQIRNCFTNKFGPRELPGARVNSNKLFGVIVPHAGYAYSGPGQAWCYKEIAESAFPDVYIILGVNHSAPKTCASSEDWETPYGTVQCDAELVKALEENGLPIDNGTHHYEHSIEIQLPFLQFVSRDRERDIRIVPIMIADDEYIKWGKIIQHTLKETGKKAVVICSSDFTHYGEDYGYTPFSDAKKEMKEFDMKAMNHIIDTNSEALLNYCKKTGATICGRNGIAVLLWLAQGETVKVLKYYTSADVLKDWNSAVGYASVVIY